MIVEGSKVDDNALLNADVCIIGSGAAGSTIALELEKKGYTVVMLEAGGLEQSKGSQKFYKGKSTGLPYSISYTRLRVLGGTTQHWAGFCAPLDPEDFKKNDLVKYSGWPISREDLDPFYLKASKILNLGEYNPDPEAWIHPKKSPAFDSNGQFSHKIWHFNSPIRFGTHYRDQFKKSEKIKIFIESPVVDMILHDDSDSVSRVVVQAKGRQFKVQAKKFVMACGGIENPRLLLNFNKQRATGLGNESGNVGRFFQEHPEIHQLGKALLTGKNAGSVLYSGFRRVKGTRGAAYLQINQDVRKQKGILNSAFHLSSRSYKPSDFDKEVQDFSNRLFHHEKYKDIFRHIQGIFEQEPDPDRRVTLGGEIDSLGLYRPEINIGFTELDYRSLRESLMECVTIFQRHHLGRIKVNHPEFFESQEAIDNKIGWGNHHMGSTRMSTDPKNGVVDENCKIHSLHNLYIGGSSVFPTSGCSNPTFTIVALAVRLAEHLDGLLQKAEG